MAIFVYLPYIRFIQRSMSKKAGPGEMSDVYVECYE